MTPTAQTIESIVDKHIDELITVRRHLHAFPELPWQENATTEYLESRLNSYSIASSRGPRNRGLIVNLGDAVPAVAIRGDLDAIPVEEKRNCRSSVTRRA